MTLLCLSSVYVAGKAATAGVPSVYAPSMYASSNPIKTAPQGAMIPMVPRYNGYGVDYDAASSGELCLLALSVLRRVPRAVVCKRFRRGLNF